MTRESAIRLLEQAENETDPAKRGLLLAEAQVFASLVIIDQLEEISGHAELSAANSI